MVGVNSGVKEGCVFDKLTVVSVTKGHKNKHPSVNCICQCGREQNVRLTDLKRGLKTQCRKCSWKTAWKKRERMPDLEKSMAAREGEYKQNAKRRGFQWSLDSATVRKILTSDCHYCGDSQSNGIDRVKNSVGYLKTNVVACCSTCNYAKRDMSEDDFTRWVFRVFAHITGGKHD